MPRPPATRAPLAACLLAVALLAGACSGAPERAAATDPAATTPVPTSDPSAAPSDLPAATPSSEPTAGATPSPSAPLPPTGTVGSADVVRAQQALSTQKYYVGPADGKAGASTRSAVMAFQKVNGLGVDGSIGPQTLAAMEEPRAPTLANTSPADRVEIDLTKQVLYVVKGGAIARIMPISSGNGARYSQKNGGRATALTPAGSFTIQRRIVGVREADLGSLYDPQYFYKGWAIHGSNSVPAIPASHGCVRVTRADAKTLLQLIDVGTTVQLYGGKHTFRAGSAAAGTDNPTGDDPGLTAPGPGSAPAAPAPVVPSQRPAPSGTSPAAAPTSRTTPPATAGPAPAPSNAGPSARPSIQPPSGPSTPMPSPSPAQ